MSYDRSSPRYVASTRSVLSPEAGSAAYARSFGMMSQSPGRSPITAAGRFNSSDTRSAQSTLSSRPQKSRSPPRPAEILSAIATPSKFTSDTQSDRDTRPHAVELQVLIRKNRDLTLQAETQASMFEQLSAKYRSAEEKLTQFQHNNPAKLLEGKLHALQGLFDQKSKESDTMKSRGDELTRHAKDLESALGIQLARVEALEREIGVQAAEHEKDKQHLGTAIQKAEGMEREVEKQADRCTEAELVTHRVEAEREKELATVRNLCRDKAKQLDDTEEALRRATAELNETRVETEKLHKDYLSLQTTVEELGANFENERNEKDAMSAKVSEVHALLEGQKADTAREARQLQEVTAELNNMITAKTDLELQVRELEGVVGKKNALEEKVKVLQSCLDRNEHDFEAEVTRHKTSKRRVEELEDRATNIATMHNKLKDAELEVQQHVGAAEALQLQLRQSEAMVTSQLNETKIEVEKNRALSGELQQAHDLRSSMEEKLSSMRMEATMKSTLEGKLKGLEAVLEAKEIDLRRYIDETGRLSQKIRNLDVVAEESIALNDEIEQMRRQQLELDEKLAAADQAKRDLAAECDQLATESTLLRSDLGTKDAKLAEVEEYLSSVKASLTLGESYHERAEALQAQLNERTDALAREQGEVEDVYAQLRSAHLEREELKARLHEQDKTLMAKQNRIEDLTENLGSQAVHVQALEDEIEKLNKEADRAAQQSELSRDQLTQLSHEMNSSRELVSAYEERARQSAEQLELAKTRQQEAEAALLKVQSELTVQFEKSEHLNIRLKGLLDCESRETTLRGKLDEMERGYGQKCQELADCENECLSLKMKVKSFDLGAVKTQQLQDHNSTLTEQLTRLRSEYGELEQDVGMKKGELKALNEALQREKDHALRLEDAQKNLQNTLNTYVQKNEAHEQAHVEHIAVEGKLVGVETDLQAKQRALDQALETNKALQMKIQRVETSLATKSLDSDRLLSLQDDLQSRDDTIRRLEADIEKRNRATVDLRSDFEKREHRYHMMEDELQRSIQAGHDLELRLRDVEAEADANSRALKEALRVAEERAARLDTDLHEVSEKATLAANQLQYHRDRLREAEDESAKRQQTVSKLEEERGRSTVEWNDLCDQLRDERETSTTQYKTISKLNSELDDLKRDLKTSKSSGTAAENRLIAEMRLKDQQLENVNAVLTELRIEVDRTAGRTSAQSEQLLLEQERCHKIELQLKHKQDEFLKATRALDEARLRGDDFERRLHSADLSLRESERKRKDVDRDLTGCHTTISELQRAQASLEVQNTTIKLRLDSQGGADREMRQSRNMASRLEGELASLRKTPLSHRGSTSPAYEPGSGRTRY